MSGQRLFLVSERISPFSCSAMQPSDVKLASLSKYRSVRSGYASRSFLNVFADSFAMVQ